MTVTKKACKLITTLQFFTFFVAVAFSGCGISARVVDLEWSTVDWKRESRKTTVNLKTGNQSALKSTHDNPIYEDEEFIQIEDERHKASRQTTE